MAAAGSLLTVLGAAPMRYAPRYQETVVEPITTANKNIQSFFMRTDHSYYVPEACRHPQYCSLSPPVLVVLDNGYIAVYKTAEERIGEREEGILKDCRLNTSRFGSARKCKDTLHSMVREQIDGRVDPKESFVQFLFCDFLPRSDLIAAVDVLVNEIGFKGIMVLPISLGASFALNQAYCVFAYPYGFSFVDDFMLADSFRTGKRVSPETQPPCRDDEDFVEEFTRLKALDDSLKFSCDACGFKEHSEERIKAHVTKEHENGTHFHYVPGKTPRETFENRLRFLFTEEKAARARQCVYSVDTSFDGSTPLDSVHALAVRGADIFRRLDCSKECWMSDKEWQAVRLRVLKEKVLFFI